MLFDAKRTVQYDCFCKWPDHPDGLAFSRRFWSKICILINTLTLIIPSLFFIAHKRPARYWWSASPPGNIHITTSWARRLSERLHGRTLLQNTPRFLTHERFISISHSFFCQMSERFLSITITDYQITAKRRCVPRARLSPTEWPWAGVVSLPLPGESRPLPYTPATPPTPSHRLPAKQQVFQKPPSLPSYVLLTLSHHHYSDFSWPPPSKLFPCDHCATSFPPGQSCCTLKHGKGARRVLMFSTRLFSAYLAQKILTSDFYT